MLNKADFRTKDSTWKSDDLWVFITNNDGLIYIKSSSQTKVLEAANNNTVSLEDFEKDKAEQLWKKGKPDAKGYFTLENSGVPKVITAISESGLEIKGNIRQGQSFRYLTVH